MSKKKSGGFKWALSGIVLGVLVSCSGILGHSDAYIKARVVRIMGQQGMCSGEQIRAPSGTDYILSAGHCTAVAFPDGSYQIHTEDGKVLRRLGVAEDSNSDLLLIEGIPGLKGLDIADHAWAGEHVNTFTHGANLDTYETHGQLIQTKMIDIPVFRLESEADTTRCASMPKFAPYPEFGLCALHVLEEITTAFIAPGSSGGAMVDASGDLVGVASASDGQFFLFVTLSDIKSFISNY